MSELRPEENVVWVTRCPDCGNRIGHFEDPAGMKCGCPLGSVLIVCKMVPERTPPEAEPQEDRVGTCERCGWKGRKEDCLTDANMGHAICPKCWKAGYLCIPVIFKPEPQEGEVHPVAVGFLTVEEGEDGEILTRIRGSASVKAEDVVGALPIGVHPVYLSAHPTTVDRDRLGVIQELINEEVLARTNFPEDGVSPEGHALTLVHELGLADLNVLTEDHRAMERLRAKKVVRVSFGDVRWREDPESTSTLCWRAYPPGYNSSRQTKGFAATDPTDAILGEGDT